MKTFKERAIKAIEKIIENYKNKNDYKKHSYNTCPLCIIYNRIYEGRDCSGCPQTDTNICGCLRTYNYKKTVFINHRRTQLDIDKRIAYLNILLKKCKKIDKKYFTPKGWKHEVFNAQAIKPKI